VVEEEVARQLQAWKVDTMASPFMDTIPTQRIKEEEQAIRMRVESARRRGGTAAFVEDEFAL
jgi:hypothetical protein